MAGKVLWRPPWAPGHPSAAAHHRDCAHGSRQPKLDSNNTLGLFWPWPWLCRDPDPSLGLVTEATVVIGVSARLQSYQIFWWKRRDVYRLLLSLSASVDGIVWPEADRQLVAQLQDLIYDVTGAPKALKSGSGSGSGARARARARVSVSCRVSKEGMFAGDVKVGCRCRKTNMCFS